ncbi:MAG: hypothetical protein AAGI17_05655 [Planctomycetota bacterium]
MTLFKAILSFAVVFVIAFVLAGWFILPHVPPTPSQPVSAVEGAYWLPNWAGYIAGVVLGGLSARATLKSTKKRHSKS